MLAPVQLSLNNVIQRRADQLLTSELGNELIMMDIENGKYISLNKTGNVIWQQIETQIKVQDLIGIFMERFNVNEEECITETLECLQKMYEENLISIK